MHEAIIRAVERSKKKNKIYWALNHRIRDVLEGKDQFTDEEFSRLNEEEQAIARHFGMFGEQL